MALDKHKEWIDQMRNRITKHDKRFVEQEAINKEKANIIELADFKELIKILPTAE